MPSVAVAANSSISADAGARIAEEGGNAVDAALAAAFVSLTTETAVCSLGGGAFVTVWPPGGDPVTVDGYVAMPGREVDSEPLGRGTREVWASYGGGMRTTVGPGSVATPGTVAALGEAWASFGRLPWSELLEPAYEWARDGFPLTGAAHEYLTHSHEVIFGRDPRSRKALHHDDGRLKAMGARIRPEGLDETLRILAEEGSEAFYRGEIGRRIADHVMGEGGILGRKDLASYRPEIRAGLRAEIQGWEIATNPPPALGGATLVAMLRLLDGVPGAGKWTPDDVRRLVRVQRGVLDLRGKGLEAGEDPSRVVQELLRSTHGGDLRSLVSSPSTIHVSAVDTRGMAVGVTASTGYGSGIMPPGTGVWLNNCLGEHELNPRGLHRWPVGARLPSNMAPTVGRRGEDGAVLAVGTPGAERIPTALLQVLLNFVHLECSLPEAVLHPRLHVERVDGEARVAFEVGLPVEELDLPTREFDELSMFFGGVEATLWSPDDGFVVASDPRREGGARIVEEDRTGGEGS